MPFLNKILNGDFASGTLDHWSPRIPENSIWWAKFSENANANYGPGDKTGTLIGSAAITNGKLSMLGNVKASCDFDGSFLNQFANRFTVEFDYYPGYTGPPTASVDFFSSSKETTSKKSMVRMHHNSNGSIYLYFYDDNGSTIAVQNVGTPPAPFVAGEKYQISFNCIMGSITESSALYIDGKLTTNPGGATPIPESRAADLGSMRVGASDGVSPKPDAEFANMIFYSGTKRDGEYDPEPADLPDVISFALSTYKGLGYEKNEDSPSDFLVTPSGGMKTGILDQAFAIDLETEAGRPYTAKMLAGKLEAVDDPYFTLCFLDGLGNLLGSEIIVKEPLVETVEMSQIGIDAVIPAAAECGIFKVVLHTEPETEPNTVAADLIEFIIGTDLEVFDQSYATADQIDTLLVSNKRWVSLAPEKKEKYLIQAADIFDNSLRLAGEKVSTAQPRKFPRDFKTYNSFFNVETQTERLRQATAHQIEFLLDNTEFGLADSVNANSAKRAGRRNVVDPIAYDFLRDYVSSGGGHYE